MKCSRCQHENPPGAKFCIECAAPLAAACTQCGSPLPPGAKFCPQCAHPAATAAAAASRAPEAYTPRHLAERIVDSRAALEGERKQVTVVFADMKGSMELLAERDPEDARKLLDPVLERMMDAVHHYEGTVNQVMGDGIMALFGAPLAHEDHAVRACYAALRMQEAIRRYTEELRRTHGIEVQIRVGINSGEVVVRSIGSDLRMDYTAVGQTTHLAARMEQLATPGSIRLTSNTLALAEGYVEVKSIGPVPVKGVAEPVPVYELVGAAAARSRLQAARARGFTRFVGRDLEMEQLRRAADEARRGRGRVVAVVGEPGVGKSRLYYEFIHSHRAADWLILESGSVSYGKATPYLPLADLLRAYFKIDAGDDARAIRVKVTGGLLTLDEALKDTVPVALWLLDALPEDSAFRALEPSERRRQTLAAVKRILLRENQLHPMMLVFEDLHWIDNETQAFLDSLVDSIPASHILLAVNYRPEYRHGWGNKTYYAQLRIDPLPPESAEDLLNELIGTDASTRSLKKLLIDRTQGSPLFLEETVRTLVESGALAGDRGAYRLVQAPETLQVPATVQAIIAARIDRLEPQEKRVLQAAAVIGTNVPFALLRAIVEIDEETLRRCLAQLQTAEFVYEAQLFPDLEFAFKHALTHEVAYASMLQDRRRALHAAIVEAMERLYAERLPEHVERLAHHAAKAGLSHKAVTYLAESGSKAVDRSANREAVAYFKEALSRLAELPSTTATLTQELEIRMALGPALMTLHGPQAAEVEEVYRRALELVEALSAAEQRFPALWGLWFVNYSRGQHDEAMAAARRLLDTAGKGDDSGQLLEAHHSHWPTLMAMGQPLEALPHLERGMALYDRDRHSKQAALYGGHDAGACAHWHSGMTRWLLGYPDLALRHVQDACRLSAELDHPMTRSISLWFAAWVYCQRGENDAALASLDQLQEIARPRGFGSWSDTAEAFGRLLKRDVHSAEAIAELHRSVGSGTHLTNWRRLACICMLAEICGACGYVDQGLKILQSIPDHGRGNFVAPEVMRVKADLLLKTRRSADGEASSLYVNALEDARRSGQKALELRSATSYARFLATQGRRDEARDALSSVYGWFTEGFDTTDLKTARTLLEEL